MADLNTLKQNVEKNTDVQQSAVTLVNGLADALDGLTQDPVAIKALAGDLRKRASEFGTAVTANTTPAAKQAPAPGAVHGTPPKRTH